MDDVLDAHWPQPLVVLDVDPTGRTHTDRPLFCGGCSRREASPAPGAPGGVGDCGPRRRQRPRDPLRFAFRFMSSRRTALFLASPLACLTTACGGSSPTAP